MGLREEEFWRLTPSQFSFLRARRDEVLLAQEKRSWRKVAALEAHLAMIAAPSGDWSADQFDPFHVETPTDSKHTLKDLLTYIAEANEAFGGKDLRKN